MVMTLKESIQNDVKLAMRAKDSARLGTLRLAVAALRQREIDERIELDDQGVIGVLERMLKQRRDSIAQYEQAGREDLAQQERFEVGVLSAYLPQPLTAEQIEASVEAALAQVAVAGGGALSAADMGRVMALLKPALLGRADIAQVSVLVKGRLSGRA